MALPGRVLQTVRGMRKLGVAAALLAALSLTLPAEAATPASGTITRSARSLKWTGSPPALESPFPDPLVLLVDQDCHSDPTNFTCDHFALKITLREAAKIQIKITDPASNPPGGTAPVNGDDWDLYVYDPGGRLIGSSHGETAKETVTFVHHKQFNGKAYDVSVRPWLVRPGSSYTGTAAALTIGR
jgi:hypothetical protein